MAGVSRSALEPDDGVRGTAQAGHSVSSRACSGRPFDRLRPAMPRFRTRIVTSCQAPARAGCRSILMKPVTSGVCQRRDGPVGGGRSCAIGAPAACTARWRQRRQVDRRASPSTVGRPVISAAVSDSRMRTLARRKKRSSNGVPGPVGSPARGRRIRSMGVVPAVTSTIGRSRRRAPVSPLRIQLL